MFDEPLPSKGGQGQLKLTFNGNLTDKLKGLYRSKYTKEDGTIGHHAVTQFEPTDARRAFPCFDEPALKATFDVTLIVNKHLVALSNMPEVSSTIHPMNESLRIVKYDTSPKMSTYLLAVVIGEFDAIEGKTNSGTKVRVLMPKGKQSQGAFSLDVGIRSLNFFDEYFAMPYPLPKMDMISIPDFAAGAMENW